MRPVVRPNEEPPSLAKNARRWTRELLRAIEEDSNSKNTKNLYRRYNKSDVKESLYDMYSGYCCYCEADYRHVSFPRIEHRKPKRQFPESTFEWENLHFCCEICNNAKGDEWNEGAPILDAASDPIEKHLTYKDIEGLGCPYRVPLTDRGETTITHADLNRDDLLNGRDKLARRIQNILLEAYLAGDSFSLKQAVDMLTRLSDGEFGSLFRWYSARISPS